MRPSCQQGSQPVGVSPVTYKGISYLGTVCNQPTMAQAALQRVEWLEPGPLSVEWQGLYLGISRGYAASAQVTTSHEGGPQSVGPMFKVCECLLP